MQHVLDSQHGQPWVESPYLRSLIAGGLAGTTVDLSLYPLDTLKTRLQSSAGFVPSGGFNGIYRGVGSALIGSAPGAALFFISYDTLKRHLAPVPGIAHNAEGKPYADFDARARGGLGEAGVHMLAASVGEVAACAVRVPTEVVKQRAQASQFASSKEALLHILRMRHSQGLRHVWMELYRGWGITVMREVPFTVIQFPLWEAMKRWRVAGSRREVSGLEGGLLGSVAGAVAAGVTTPLDVLKTRMMLAKEKRPMAEMLGTILRESGPRAFFAGLGPRVGWISVGGAIFLGSYQWASNVLGGMEEA